MHEEFKEQKYVEKEKAELRDHLRHYPAEAGHPSLERMAEFAAKLGESISEQVGVMQRADGWYVNKPDGTTSRVATFEEASPQYPPKDVYLVYHSNRTVDIGRSVFGTEFRMERVTSVRPEHGEGSGVIDSDPEGEK